MAEVFPSPPLLGKRRAAPMDADAMEEGGGGGGSVSGGGSVAGAGSMTVVADAAVGGAAVADSMSMAMEGEDSFYGGCKRRRALGYEPSAAVGMFGSASATLPGAGGLPLGLEGGRGGAGGGSGFGGSSSTGAGWGFGSAAAGGASGSSSSAAAPSAARPPAMQRPSMKRCFVQTMTASAAGGGDDGEGGQEGGGSAAAGDGRVRISGAGGVRGPAGEGSGAGQGAEGEEVAKLRAEVRALRSENSGLKAALAQAQEAVAAYDRDNKILKRGVAVQNGKIERGEAELESLRQGNRQALEHIGRLEQANRALCYRLMLIQQGAGASGATCNDFINHPPPPDVF